MSATGRCPGPGTGGDSVHPGCLHEAQRKTAGCERRTGGRTSTFTIHSRWAPRSRNGPGAVKSLTPGVMPSPRSRKPGQKVDGLTDTPGSVLPRRCRRGSSGHPSTDAVADALQRPTRTLGRAALKRVLSGLAPGGVYLAFPVTREAGGLLHHRFTLTCPCRLCNTGARRRSVLCGTGLRVTPSGRYPPPCSAEPGRSSSHLRDARPPGQPIRCPFYGLSRTPGHAPVPGSKIGKWRVRPFPAAHAATGSRRCRVDRSRGVRLHRDASPGSRPHSDQPRARRRGRRRRPSRRLPRHSVAVSVSPATVSTRTGAFVLAFRPAVTTIGHWRCRFRSTQTGCPVAIFLHGLGGSSEILLRDLEATGPYSSHLDDGGPPFAVAAVDGGDSWWHARADGSDTQSMLVKEFVPFLGEQGLDLGRVGLFGMSMGGFGALLLASQGRVSGLRAVAAMSPAIWDQLRRRGWTAPSTARPISPRMTCSRSGPGSQRFPSGSTAAARMNLPPWCASTVRGCPAGSREASSPAATTPCTGGQSCRRCWPSWAVPRLNECTATSEYVNWFARTGR